MFTQLWRTLSPGQALLLMEAIRYQKCFISSKMLFCGGSKMDQESPQHTKLFYLGSHSLILSKKWNRHHKYHSRSLNGCARALQIFRPFGTWKILSSENRLGLRMFQVRKERAPRWSRCLTVTSKARRSYMMFRMMCALEARPQVFPKSCLWVLTCHSLNQQQPHKKSFNKKWDNCDHIGSSFYLNFVFRFLKIFMGFVKGFSRGCLTKRPTDWLSAGEYYAGSMQNLPGFVDFFFESVTCELAARGSEELGEKALAKAQD